MANEDFVTFEQAQQLKELGFDWWGTTIYLDGHLTPTFILSYAYTERDNCLPAPTIYLVQKWFREVKGMLILIQHNKNFYWTISTNDSDHEVIAIYEYETYEKALLGAINKALELLKNE